jgi:hypothetical protein
MSDFSDKSIGGIIRGIALWVMIIGAVAADFICYWRGQIVWGTFWSCIIALVIGYEIYGKFISKEKKTISNMFRDWIVWEKENKKFPWGRTTLIILWTALTALIVHLWFF